MATGSRNCVIDYLRRVVAPRHGTETTDGQLLDRFVAQRDAGAFEALMRRHGPMVLGVCRRVLHHAHDAEDAFQATFLVLVRRAASVLPREMVGNWLYGVAYRTALEARGATAKRHAKEREMAKKEELVEDPWRELQPVLDQELTRLPDKYRVPIVLCDLEGKTRKEAARHLGWPEGTLSGRLSRARVMLAKRLAKQGLTFSGGAVALVLSQNGASAQVPASLLVSTLKAAVCPVAGSAAAAGVVSPQVAALTEGVLKAMFVTKLKNVMVVALAGCLLGWGAKAIAFRTNDLPGNSAPKQVLKAPAPKPSAEDAKPDLPKGPAPIQVLASIDKEGQIVIQQIVIQMLQTEFTETGVLLPPTENEIRALHRRLGDAIGAGKGGGTGVSHLKVTGKYKTEEVKAFTANGKKVDPKDLAKKLEKEIPVLMAADGKEVDPLHLRLIKDGILVLVLPLPPAEEAQKEEERRREREILQKVIDKQNKDFGGANPVVPPSEDPKKP